MSGIENLPSGMLIGVCWGLLVIAAICISITWRLVLRTARAEESIPTIADNLVSLNEKMESVVMLLQRLEGMSLSSLNKRIKRTDQPSSTIYEPEEDSDLEEERRKVERRTKRTKIKSQLLGLIEGLEGDD